MARIDREGPIHRSIVVWLRFALPDALVIHIRNEINKGGWRIAKEIGQAKAKGALKGAPDLMILPAAAIGALFFEVKAEGNYADKDQKALHERMRDLGYRVAVVRSIEDVAASLSSWGIATRVSPSVQKLTIKGSV